MLKAACYAYLLLAAAPAYAQPLGRIITDVRVDMAGVPAADAAVLELIETRVGEPLDMHSIRRTIDHLVGLGRFEDVRVLATATEPGVSLRWPLVPVRRISRIRVTGATRLSASAVRTELAERFGAMPSANRVNDMVARLQAFYADRGFPAAAIRPRLLDDEQRPEQTELVVDIEAGDRVTVGSAAVTGSPLEPDADVLRQLGLLPGRPFDQPAIDARLASYEESLRERGYYQARVRTSHLPADQRTMALTIAVEPGPRVRLVFAGDPLPGGDPERWVPIRAERSVDQDLLDDASQRIETAFRQQGYRNARAPYTRAEQAGELVITFTIDRGPLHRIESIEVRGNVRIPHADLAPLLQLKPGEPLDDQRVSLVGNAIAVLYTVRGFTEAAVNHTLEVLPEAMASGLAYRPVAIRFTIEEGIQTIVKAVTFQGPAASLEQVLRSQTGLAGGKPFYRVQQSVDRDAIARTYRNLGYQSARVTSQLNFEDQRQSVSLVWTIEPGDQVTVDRVLINGGARFNPSLIRRELRIAAGDPMNDDALLESQRNLASLGLFRRVRITEVPRSGSLSRDVLVVLEEADSTTIDYGGGIEVSGIGGRDDDGGATDKIDVGPRGFFSISRRNLWGKNRSVTLFGRVTVRSREPAASNTDPTDTGGYGFNDYRGVFTFREPRAYGTSGDAQFTAFVEQSRRTSFTFNRKGVTTDYARRLGAFTFTGRYGYDYTKIFDDQIAADDQLLIDRLFPQVKLSKFQGGLSRDSRDDVLDPQRGAVIGIDGSVAAKAYGSEVGFVKTFLQGFVYRRLPGRGVVLAAGARLGVAVGFAQEVPPPAEIAGRRHRDGEQAQSRGAGALPNDGDRAGVFPTVIRELPASERFFAGGDTTVRGFALDRLGTALTLDEDGFPKGGNGLAIVNLEARAPYWKNLQFVWFLDAGNVFAKVTDIRLNELRMSSGLGFRYRSPIGPLRVDWGWKLSTRLLLTGGRERSNVLHISLGQAF